MKNSKVVIKGPSSPKGKEVQKEMQEGENPLKGRGRESHSILVARFQSQMCGGQARNKKKRKTYRMRKK